MHTPPSPAAAIRAALLHTFQTFAPGVILSLLVTLIYTLAARLGVGS